MGTAARRLANARRNRAHATAALNALRTGTVTLEQTLETPPPALARIPIHTVIRETRGMGPAGAKKCLLACKIWPEEHLGALTREQLRLIIRHLPPRARYERVS